MGTSRQLFIIASGAAVAAMLLFAAALWYSDTRPAPKPASEESVIESATESRPRLTDIEAGAEALSSPIIFSGYAGEDWFSPQGTFDVELQDEDLRVLGTGKAVANGPANTAHMRPFTATVSFEAPPGLESGMLVLNKHNPTGRPEDGAQYGIEVRFNKEQVPEE